MAPDTPAANLHYRNGWDDAKQRTYALNTERDRDGDGHACE